MYVCMSANCCRVKIWKLEMKKLIVAFYNKQIKIWNLKEIWIFENSLLRESNNELLL